MLRAQLARHLQLDSELWRRAFHWGVHHAPEWWIRAAPPIIGVAWGAVLEQQRVSARDTLRRLKGPRPQAEELRDVAAVFSNYARCMTDALLLGTGRGYEARTVPRGGAHLKAALAEGRGLIVAAAHTAGWDIGGSVLRDLQSAQVIVVMEPEQNAAARELHDAARRRTGVTLMHAGDDPLASLPLLHHLRRRQGVVAMKMDRISPGMRTRSVRFLGAPWRVPEGILRLAALSGAPILPVFTRRLGFLKYEAIANPAIVVSRRPDDAELDAAAQTLAAALERFARAHPTQWFRFSGSQAP